MSLDTQGSTPLYADTTLFRDLYTRVVIHAGEENHNVLGVTSAIDGEGKTTVALTLATMLTNDRVLAGSSKRAGDILIIDCNRGAAGAMQEFAVDSAPGLVQYLRQECPVESIVKPTFLPHLWVLPSGGAVNNLSVLIRTSTMLELMNHLRERFDVIILDLPSILTTTDTHVLASLTDQLLLVVRSGATPRKLLTQALGELDRDKLLGMVLNDNRTDLPRWIDQRL